MIPAVELTGLGSAAAVLWDIDGTLLLSGGVTARAFLVAVEQVAQRRPDVTGIDFGGRIDPEIARLLLATVEHDASHVPAVLARLAVLAQEQVEALNAQTRPLAGVVELLHRLAGAGVPQTVVTGNIESVARLKLAAAGLVPPIDPAFGGYGDSGADRVEVARVALLRLFGPDWPEVADRCWIIGDTPRDLACAQALGLRCALVGTGRRSAESLTGLGADLVLSALDQPAELGQLWDGVQPAQ
jgi:phosphoglycolate phosphatase-like HAD superfamily hydrolase